MQQQIIRPTQDYWEERANYVLSHFNYRYPDEIDLYEICWKYGIKIMPLHPDFTETYVDYESINKLKSFSVLKSSGRRGTIFIAEGLNAIEKKLLLAEEFCHCYSHDSSQLHLDKHLINKQENQAKRMAAYLLMPFKFLKQIYQAAVTETVLISDIADYFVVTEEFARYRLELTYHHRVDGFATLKNKLGSLEWI
ncbi:ImmA/IrrE family metallo-endopeptidase [Caldibacillus lycopersici]|uniref:ImmA/IrrE family metallo-endopeptidase n=1 Tax=Perspicuibacillus lycopersici TaxID=1325689 RepID=A0AAE3LTK3_9BACI|nr:ImmA/IrrE family metallo-endopeptidase [Perspicuibacillus lycopersici]MCU9614128.1 ImmA/IrrE family metallo-endopeptidase [Perspicuibacillus lycopersici]